MHVIIRHHNTRAQFDAASRLEPVEETGRNGKVTVRRDKHAHTEQHERRGKASVERDFRARVVDADAAGHDVDPATRKMLCF